MCFWYKVPKFEHSLVIFSLANWSNTKIPAFLPASLRAVQIPEFLCRVQKADILPVSKIPALSRAWHPAISPSRVYIAFNWALNLSPWISESKMHISMQLWAHTTILSCRSETRKRNKSCVFKQPSSLTPIVILLIFCFKSEMPVFIEIGYWGV